MRFLFLLFEQTKSRLCRICHLFFFHSGNMTHSLARINGGVLPYLAHWSSFERFEDHCALFPWRKPVKNDIKSSRKPQKWLKIRSKPWSTKRLNANHCVKNQKNHICRPLCIFFSIKKVIEIESQNRWFWMFFDDFFSFHTKWPVCLGHTHDYDEWRCTTRHTLAVCEQLSFWNVLFLLKRAAELWWRCIFAHILTYQTAQSWE